MMTNDFTISVVSWLLAFNYVYYYLDMSMLNNVVEVHVYATQRSTKILIEVYTNGTWH